MMQERLDGLLEAVGNATSVLILPHNDPDPDAIASAVALRYLLAERLGVEGRIAYKGIIGRAENRALVRYLGRPLRHLAGSDLRQPVLIALVDTQPGAGNNALPSPPRRSLLTTTLGMRRLPLWTLPTFAPIWARPRPS
jgi:nanoRNase/pAp phosphatase (c-di-AMP/oligoRNAs hydrolase)